MFLYEPCCSVSGSEETEMTLDLVVEELGNRLVRKGGGLDDALGLQAVAATDSAVSEEAWGSLEQALLMEDSEARVCAGVSLAYTAVSSEEDWEKALEIYRDGACSGGWGVRLAVVQGLRKAVELNPGVAEDVAVLLGCVLDDGLQVLAGEDVETGSVEDVVRCSVKALVEIGQHDSQLAVDVVSDQGLGGFVMEEFPKGLGGSLYGVQD